jgi:hypothetical protein
MLKTIKKIALLSLFTYSFILPMRQVAQAALTSVLQNRQVAQILVARRLDQSASLHNSLVTRYPFVDVLEMVEQIADVQAAVEICQEIETQTTMMADQAVEAQATAMVAHESALTNLPDHSNSHL